MDYFLEHRVRDLASTARQQAASGSLDAAAETYRTALAAVDDALSFDPSNRTAAGLREELVESMAQLQPVSSTVAASHDEGRRGSVKAPSFALLREGDLVGEAEFAPADGGYLPEPEMLSIRDTTPHPEKPDYLRIAAAIIAVVLLAVAVRVAWYYGTHRVVLDPRPLPEQSQLAPPALNTPAAGAEDDTVYFADPGVTLPVLRSKSQPRTSGEGKVILLAVIDPTGRPVNARIWHGLDAKLNVEAIQTAGQWRFQPGTKDGKPVPVIAQLEISFRK